jgi:hypothetical protein
VSARENQGVTFWHESKTFSESFSKTFSKGVVNEFVRKGQE